MVLSMEQILKGWIKHHKKDFELQEDLVFKKEGEKLLLFIPEQMRNDIMYLHHDDILGSHFRRNKTLDKIRSRYWWPHMRQDIEKWVQTCQDCQRRKGPKETKIGFLKPIPVGRPFETIAFDVMGPLPKTKHGNQYIFVVMDMSTKWAEAFALPDQKANTVAKVLVEQIICHFGAPKKFLSDKGTNFTSKLVHEICLLLGINQTTTTAYHPQCDGLVERFNRTLAERLSFFVNREHDNWELFIPYALFAYRTAKQESTGFTPAFLLFYRELNLPSEVMIKPTQAQRKMSEIFKGIEETF